MAGWLESMSDIMQPMLSAGGMAAGGPVGGIAGSLAGSMLEGVGSTPDGSAAASGTQTTGSWVVGFAGKNNPLLIVGIIAAIYFLFVKGK